MKKTFLILLTLLTSPVYAEVFKCQLESGKTVYQSTPCVSAVKQQTIEIQKTDPGKVAEAEAKLKAWKENYAAREAERIKAEQALQAERDRKASVAALQKSAEYQRQQAYEAKRQADALEQKTMQSPQSFLFYPYYPSYPTFIPHQHDMYEKNHTSPRKYEHSELKNGVDTDANSSGARIFINVK